MKTRMYYILILFLFNFLFSFTQSPVPENATVEKIAFGFNFVEGPVWKDDVGLLFSDIPANIIYQWTPESGVSVYLEPSGNSNGLAFDLENRLIMAQHGKRQVARLEPNGTETPLATHYDGKKLNSPNDLAIKSDGSIFFTDPPYGLNDQGGTSELGYNGIFRLNNNSQVQLLDKSLYRPNGIAFSPNESLLYVTDSESRTIYMWDVIDDTTIANKRQFAIMDANGYADGMKVDENGNLFISGPIGIWVYAPNGTLFETISVPGQTSNCNFGDEDRKTLYITSGDAIYRLRLEKSNDTSATGEVLNKIKPAELYLNYPNPIHEFTQIPFFLSKNDYVYLGIYNAIGKEIQVLINKPLYHGHYQIYWNPVGLSDGLYYVRLSTTDCTIIKNCILIN